MSNCELLNLIGADNIVTLPQQIAEKSGTRIMENQLKDLVNHALSRQYDIQKNLPIAVDLRLPDREKTAAIDRQLAIFEQPDFPVS
jgi:hypothetical protein